MWIPIEQSLLQHPKTKKLKRLLKCSYHESIGYMVCFWHWVASYAPTGNITNHEHDLISDGCDWQGEPEDFINALFGAGFIKETEEGICVNGWHEYAGKFLEKAREQAEKMRELRRKKRESEGERDSNVIGTLQERDSNVGGNVNGTLWVRKEKKIQEKKIKEDSLSSFGNDWSVSPSSANPLFLEKPIQQEGLSEEPSNIKQEEIPFSDNLPEEKRDLDIFLGDESVAMICPPKKSASYPQPVDKCPHKEIIGLYHSILPSLPKIKTWTEVRKKLLKSRWSEKKERQNLDWWKEFFTLVASSDFLLGRSGQSFQANLEWLITPKYFTRVLEGNYTNRRQMNVFQSAAMKDPDEILAKFHLDFQGENKDINADYSIEELI